MKCEAESKILIKATANEISFFFGRSFSINWKEVNLSTDEAYDGKAEVVGEVVGTCGAIAVWSTGFCTCVDLTDCIIIGECVLRCQEPIIFPSEKREREREIWFQCEFTTYEWVIIQKICWIHHWFS